MEYSPYGEQWIDEGSDRSIIGYRFTSKELDSETGLYNFGKRYLDPVTSRWMSADQAVQSYLPEAPVNDQAKKRNLKLPDGGGVFNPFALSFYGYSNNNPLKYQDPDGDIIVQYTSQLLMTDSDWAGDALGEKGDTVGTAGCFVTAVSNLINTITGAQTVTPGDIAANSDIVDKNGDLSVEKVQQAIRSYTGNDSLNVSEVSNSPKNPSAVAETLLKLEKSDKKYLVIGEATIQHGGVVGSHFLNITGAGMRSYPGVAQSGPVLEWVGTQGTSANDTAMHRQYGLSDQNLKENKFVYERILFVEIPND